MKEEEELSWLGSIDNDAETEATVEESKEEELPESVTAPEEEEKVVEETKPQEDVLKIDPKLAKKCLTEMYKKLTDEQFAKSERMDFSTATRIADMIESLIENKGEWIHGRKSLDGWLIQCPIHNHAPMYLCYKCEHWIGKKNPEGVCERDMEDIDMSAEKYSHNTARQMEIDSRKEKTILSEN